MATVPSSGTWSDVFGMLPDTLSRKMRKLSRTTTPIWTFCAGVQKNIDNSRTLVISEGIITLMT